ncbi:MAG: hypothetical protein K0U86_20335 [Planctomycetes bacterium]|nr:hypothetical protein [Planctomycetota bacterium]MCH9727252.1 hypothetical protein [Planctomycetota bacterium]MCH9776747.1 hypothetical protein [Planctomycetota bacterium]MCH9791273.1 hypothetical protein [Planctomycetota bacterium]
MLFQSRLAVFLIIALGFFLGDVVGETAFAQSLPPLHQNEASSQSPALRHRTIFMPRENEIKLMGQSPQVPDVLDAEARDALGIPPQLLDEEQSWSELPEEDEEIETFVPLIAHKRATAGTTWLPGNGDELGIFSLNLSETFDFPRSEGFTVTPRFGVHYLDGPVRTDLPARVYDTSVAFRWFKKFNDKWSYELEVAPGVYSDFKNVTSDSVRITGRGLAYYMHSRSKQFVVGVVYLDREDLSLLPAVGMIMWFSEGSRLELIFPKPKFTYRIEKDESKERWLYVAGEFGGGSWGIRRGTAGVDDVATYSDLRLIGGLETKHTNGMISQFEIGYVFNRKLEYKSQMGDYDISPTGMIRYQLTF